MTADTHYSPSYVAKVTARRNRSSLTARLTVAPGLNVIQVPVGDRPNDVGLQVYFTGPLPEPGGTVAVRSDDPAVSVPATHTFQGGATGGGVPGITVQPVTEETEVALSVTYGRRTVATTTTLVPPADPYDVIATLVAQNARETEYGGTRSGQYDVWLDAPAPPGGLEFAWRIRDEDPVATLDTSPYGHVPGGGTKAAARLLLAPVASTHVVVLEAAFGDRVFELPITIEPRPTDLVLPDSVVGGDTFTGSVVTAGPASVDTVVELVAFGPVDLPARVVVRAGETAASFTGTTFSVEEERVVTVHGSFGAGHSLETAYTTVVP
ncbi:hypothetical protein [Nocardioides aestuarii]|uniref:IPT/TIG domain-containing protein n=1 Tax=Nocardioides aestuarii TaxID=252231 RepID=A0ABW4TLE0_9ACTN